jgi:hypothetical protein
MERQKESVYVACGHCNTAFELKVFPEDLKRWLDGEGNIQDRMPYLTDEERELLLSFLCGKCWNLLFPKEEKN